MTDKTLHVFQGEDEWVVAYDNNDAWQVLFEFTGNKMSDYCDKEDFATFWTILPDEQTMKIDLEGTYQDDDRITLTQCRMGQENGSRLALWT